MKTTIGAIGKAAVLFGGLSGMFPAAAKAKMSAIDGCPGDGTSAVWLSVMSRGNRGASLRAAFTRSYRGQTEGVT